MIIDKIYLPALIRTFTKLFLVLILPAIAVQIDFAQTVETKKKDRVSAELRKNAVSFLRETAVDVANMRTLENRISFSAELANLMWFDDEKEARVMFKSVISDFSGLLTQFDVPESPSETDADSNLLVGGNGGFDRKFYQAIAVRQQIAVNLAQHDPQMAFDFLAETAQAVTNPKLRAQMEQNSYFEMQLLTKIAEKDVDVALKYGRKKLEKGFDDQMTGVLKKIYAKDAEKGASFGEDILKKIKSSDATSDNFYQLNSLLILGTENIEQIKKEPGKRPMFSEQAMRDLADLLAQALLKVRNLDISEIKNYLPQIEKFSPARAAQIRQKINTKNVKTGDMPTDYPSAQPEMPVPNTSQADAKKKIMEEVAGLNTKTLSKDEKQKVIEQARKIIAEVKNREQKLLALSVLAAQVAISGDKETASQIMEDARSLINPQPKNYREYTETWIVTSGYAAVDTDKAFPMLEETIFRLNETIAAFVKVGEFIDTSNEIIVEGELQVGSFGGEMTRGLLRNLGAVDTTIINLAKADFVRTKALTNKFDRQEVRILAKMIVLRGILGESEPENAEFFH